jgi:hypothetical protein
MLRTAAGLFEELGLFKEMVECYISMDEEHEAEKICTEQVRAAAHGHDEHRRCIHVSSVFR